MGKYLGLKKRWSVFRDGPLCEAVRYRVSTVLADSFSIEWHSLQSDCKYSREEHTQFFFFNSFVYIFILREFVRLRHNRLFLYRFARLVLRWFTVIGI